MTGAVELGSTVVGGGLGLFTILKSALYIIDSHRYMGNKAEDAFHKALHKGANKTLGSR